MDNENMNLNENVYDNEASHDNENDNENVNDYNDADNYALQSENENKTPNTICLISAVLMFGTSALNALFTWIMHFLRMDGSGNVFYLVAGIKNILNTVICIFPLAGFVLMIYLRVKYPGHIGGKVLMWVTIAAIIWLVIMGIMMIIACVSCINSIPPNCG